MATPPDDRAPSANPEAEERIQFMLRLRARGIRDLRLLRALERAPRALFMPQRYADVAARDIALPIGGGQTSPPPSVVAAMIEALDPPPRGRVLEVGAGSGYATALLAQLSGEVVSLERRRPLALEAAARLSAFGIDNAQVEWADALAYDPGPARFDAILVHAAVESPPMRLLAPLAEGGALVAVVAGERAADQRIVRWVRQPGRDAFDASECGSVRAFRPLTAGLAGGD
jgi:protein-L-isoaspartate(D-aspartate) O-methyltransferase